MAQLGHAEAAEPTLSLGSFEALIALVAEKRDITTKMALERDVRLVRFEDGQIEIAVGVRHDPEQPRRLDERRVVLEGPLQRRDRGIVPAERVSGPAGAKVKDRVPRTSLQSLAKDAGGAARTGGRTRAAAGAERRALIDKSEIRQCQGLTKV